MNYFQTKGDKAEATIVYDFLKTLDVGQIASYDQLDQLLDRDFRASRSPIYQAQKRLERNNKRTVAPVPNIGYQVVEANQHEGLARHHLKKSNRQILRARSKAKSADRSKLTVAEKTRIDAIELNLSQLYAIQRSQSRRIDKLEKTVETTDKRVDSHQSELGGLQDRITHLEGLLEAKGFVDVKKRRRKSA